jgi:hypothetical protein
MLKGIKSIRSLTSAAAKPGISTLRRKHVPTAASASRLLGDFVTLQAFASWQAGF